MSCCCRFGDLIEKTMLGIVNFLQQWQKAATMELLAEVSAYSTFRCYRTKYPYQLLGEACHSCGRDVQPCGLVAHSRPQLWHASPSSW
jgi:hypothetical protein